MDSGRLDIVATDHLRDEIASQPELWRWTGQIVAAHRHAFPPPDTRVAAIGCGTSWFMAQSYAALREARQIGETDAFSPATWPSKRAYDHLVVISRSGTTSDLIPVLEQRSTPATLVTTVVDTPLARLADRVVVLDRAAEHAVVQTRSATCALMTLRRSVGDDVTAAIADAEAAVRAPLPRLPEPLRQLVFLGSGWSVGVAEEAALKCREAAAMWAEAYPATEYRHGPIAVAGPGTLVWALSPLPEGLDSQIAETGAAVHVATGDPLAELVLIQRVAHDLAVAAGRDPDHPAGLSFSVILERS